VASNVQHNPFMVKAFATSALAVAMVFGGTLVFVACSSSSDSTFPPDPPKPDAEPDAPGSFLPEGGGTPEGGEGGAPCKGPSIPDSFTPVWKAPTKTAACTTQQISDYFTKCLADPSTTEKDGTCAAFRTDTANMACAACAEATDQSGPIQWAPMRSGYTLNIAGCIDVEQRGTDAGASGCGEAYNAAVQCTRAACTTCMHSPSEFNECEKMAGMTGLCATKETAQSAACQGYKTAGSPALACFPMGSEQMMPQTWLSRVIAATCGM
jgi:hypothetical protein